MKRIRAKSKDMQPMKRNVGASVAVAGKPKIALVLCP
jgi:hypothetical protein